MNRRALIFATSMRTLRTQVCCLISK